MDRDTKVTYSVITILIIILGAIAYYLQGNVNLPQVQVTQDTVGSTITPKIARKAVIQTESLKSNQPNSTSTVIQLPEKITSAVITTNKGIIEITFATNSPETIKNFAKLALDGFYNGTRVHRVIRDFMIQGGDPLSKDLDNKNVWGTGGPGYSFSDEFHADDQFTQGTLAMANFGPNTNGSQFFIVTAIAGTPWLIGKHTVFGHVTKGLDVVLDIGDVQTDSDNRPIQDVIVNKIEIK